jgi:hypothetical protein
MRAAGGAGNFTARTLILPFLLEGLYFTCKPQERGNVSVTIASTYANSITHLFVTPDRTDTDPAAICAP